LLTKYQLSNHLIKNIDDVSTVSLLNENK